MCVLIHSLSSKTYTDKSSLSAMKQMRYIHPQFQDLKLENLIRNQWITIGRKLWISDIPLSGHGTDWNSKHHLVHFQFVATLKFGVSVVASDLLFQIQSQPHLIAKPHFSAKQREINDGYWGMAELVRLTQHPCYLCMA